MYTDITLYIVQSIVYIVNLTYTVHCTLYSIHYYYCVRLRYVGVIKCITRKGICVHVFVCAVYMQCATYSVSMYSIRMYSVRMYSVRMYSVQ